MGIARSFLDCCALFLSVSRCRAHASRGLAFAPLIDRAYSYLNALREKLLFSTPDAF